MSYPGPVRFFLLFIIDDIQNIKQEHKIGIPIIKPQMPKKCSEKIRTVKVKRSAVPFSLTSVSD